MTLRVVSSHKRSYEKAIAFCRGDVVEVVREDLEQPGWFWCVGPGGSEGWVYAQEFLSGLQGRVEGTRDFDAMELSVEPGDEVEGAELVGGWWLCQAPDNRSGWVPAACLERV